MPTSNQVFYEFLNDLGDLKGITLIAMYADLHKYLNLVSDQGPKEQIQQAAQTIFKDYIVEDNTYSLESNELLEDLRELYSKSDRKIMADLDQALFEDLYSFCIGGL